MPNVPKEPELLEWLNGLPLYGNWRDLEKIAIYYNAFSLFDDSIKEMINERSPFEYAKEEFQKYHSPNIIKTNEKFNFGLEKTYRQMKEEYLYNMRKWALGNLGSRKKAAEKLGVDVNTLDSWKNKDSQKKEKQNDDSN
jgi:hypothetical protein